MVGLKQRGSGLAQRDHIPDNLLDRLASVEDRISVQERTSMTPTVILGDAASLISTHAADAGAHHAPVTIGTGGLSAKLALAGQELTLAAIDHADLSNIDANQHIDHTAVTLTAGSGLTGGGTIAATRTLSADWGTPTIGTIQPDASANAGTSTNPARSDHRHAIVAAAASTLNPDQANAEGSATSFARSDHIHNVPAAAATTLTVASTNTEGASTSFARANHTHAITTSANPGAAASILASSAAGYLTLVQLNTDTLEDRSGGNLTVSPAGDLHLAPTGAQVRAMSGVQLQADNYASQTTGWAVSYAGSADFRYVFTDELHAKAFVADLEQALAGGQIISKSVAILSRDFTAPAAGGTATLYVEDLPSAEDMAVFQSGDIVRIREFSRAAGSLSITNCWGVVTSYSNLSDKEQSWTFTRSTAPNAGAMTGGTVIGAGAIVLDYGTTGNGFYEVNAIDGAYAINSPYAQTVTWTTHPATGQTVRTRLGNLRGITATTEHGLYAGEGVATGDAHMLLSDQTLEIHDIPMAFYDSSDTQRIGIDPDAGAAEKLMWAGASSADPRFVVYGDGDVWLSNLALSPTLADQFFTQTDGLLLLGPNCPMTETSWTSLRGQEATISGAFHPVAGPWAQSRALMVENNGTNKVANGIFASGDTTSWSTFGGSSISVVVDYPYIGDYCLELELLAAYHGCRQTIALSTDTAYTVSARMRTDDDVTLYMQIFDVDGSASLASTAYSLSAGDGWETKYFTFTTDSAHTNYELRFYTTGSSGYTVYLDGIQIETGDYYTSVIDGSLSWCSHDGTAFQSSSSRLRTNISTSAPGALDIASGSLAMWIKIGVQEPSRYRTYFWHADGSNNNRIQFYYDPLASKYYVRFSNGSGSTTLLGNTASMGAGWHHVVATWDSSSAHLYIDGVEDASGSSPSLPDTLQSTMYIGRTSISGSEQYADSAIGEVATLGIKLTAEQVAALYHRNAPLADAGAFDAPGVYILDGRFSLATSTSGARTQIDPSGWRAWNADGDAAFALALEDSLSWDGSTLDTNDIQIGRSADHYIAWDDSAGTLSIKGSITLTNTITAADISDVASGADVTADNPQASSWLTDVADSTYAMVLSTDISAGHILLSAASGDLDDIDNGTSYAKVLATDLSSGHIKLTSNTVVDGEWYNESGVEIDASSGINIYGTDNALTTRATKTGTIQCSVNSSGAIVAGAGAVTLNADGLTITSGATDKNIIKFQDGSNLTGALYSYTTSSTHYIRLMAAAPTVNTARGWMTLLASPYSGGDAASVRIRSEVVSTGTSPDVAIVIGADDVMSIDEDRVALELPLDMDTFSSEPSSPASGRVKLFCLDSKTVGGNTFHDAVCAKFSDGTVSVIAYRTFT